MFQLVALDTVAISQPYYSRAEHSTHVDLEPMDVLASGLPTNDPPEKNLLPNSLVTPVNDDVMQVDEEVSSSADRLTDNDKLSM